MEETLTTKTINKLLLEVQQQLDGVAKNANNPHFKSSYADYNAVLEAVKEPLNTKGILIDQIPDADDLGRYVKTSLIHVESGEEKSCKVYLELPKPDMQKLGSAITYAKRYGLQTLCVLPSEDDDANSTNDVVQKVANTKTSSKSGFNGSSTVKKVAKKVVTKKVTLPTVALKQGFGSKGAKVDIPVPITKTVASPINKGFGNTNIVTPPPSFDNKPSFGNRGTKAEPEF